MKWLLSGNTKILIQNLFKKVLLPFVQGIPKVRAAFGLQVAGFYGSRAVPEISAKSSNVYNINNSGQSD